MDDVLVAGAVHEAVVVYHEWWMGALFWTCAGVGILGIVLFAISFVAAEWWIRSHPGDMGVVELFIPGAFLLMIDVPLWAVYGALKLLFGFQ